LQSDLQELNRLIDLDRYPLDAPGSSEWASLVGELSHGLSSAQYCQLPGFLRDSARQEEIDRLRHALPHAHAARSLRNIYLEREGDPTLPSDHPRNIMNPASYRMVGAHLLPQDSVLKRVYHWAPFREFVAAVTGGGPLYPSADPYQPVNVICYGDGDRSAWHFDSDNAFTMTLMLQAPESGGEFQILPNSRSGDDPNEAGLSRFLGGDRSGVLTLDRGEGALMMFRGCHSAHRVRAVSGPRMRMMGVMVYEDKPGVMGDPVVNATVYGV
jgi:hypothetical protein